jgi:hypothetical protein
MAYKNTMLNEIDIMGQMDNRNILKMLAFSFNIYSETNFIIYVVVYLNFYQARVLPQLSLFNYKLKNSKNKAIKILI